MSKFSMFINRALLSIILSLSATVICAEVSAKGIGSAGAANKAVTQDIALGKTALPAQSSERTATWSLYAEQWELARSGETILSLPAINQLIEAWLSDRQKKIEIHYPGGEDGEVWVQELSDWLVSLGIPSRHMIITPGSGADDVIKFDIIK